jgi:opacity protein-like surface antigen
MKDRPMTPRLMLALTLGAAALAASPASAAWTTAGDALAGDGTLTLSTAYALAGDPDAPFNLSGRSAVGIDQVESAAGLAPYALDLSQDEAATEGSVAWQSFAVAAGDTLRFDWQFETRETDFEDHAFLVLDGRLLTLATRSQPGAAARTFSHSFSAGGLATLALGVVDTVDYLGVSTLTVSNLQISPVPEPATALLWAGGLLALGALRRRAR